MPRLLTRGDDPSPISATGWPASSRNGGRHQIGTLAGFASEWVAGFHRNPHCVVLAAAHRDHDTANNAGANLAAFCQRCHMIHDRPEHRRRRWATLFRRKALGDLFRGPYA